MVLLAALPVMSAMAAQTVDLAALERCARLATAELKLACYEALTADDSGTNARGTGATAASGESASNASVSPADTSAETVAPVVADSPGPASAADDSGTKATGATATAAQGAPAVSVPPATREPEAGAGAAAGARLRDVTDAPSRAAASAGGVAASQSSAVGPDQPAGTREDSAMDRAAAAQAAAEPAPIPDELGAEQLPKPIEEPTGPTAATVIKVTRDYRNRLDFHLANGHVWRQIEPRRFRYPQDREFDVVISQGLMGEYRLRVDGKGPMVRIRRVK